MHELFLLHFGRLGDINVATGRVEFSQVPGYLIKSASGRAILVDTGNPAELIGAEFSRWGEFHCAVEREDDVEARLAQLGLKPSDVDLLVSTHFDFDHCGRHDLFAAAGVESLVQRRHLEKAGDPDSRYDRTLWDLPGIRYTAIDGDRELEPGLTLLSTSGHAIGHQSVLIETSDGPVILAADAISSPDLIESRECPDWYDDIPETLASLDRLVALAAETGACLLFGHDLPQWDALPKSPAPFRRP